jgi:uncharacterized protein DUF955
MEYRLRAVAFGRSGPCGLHCTTVVLQEGSVARSKPVDDGRMISIALEIIPAAVCVGLRKLAKRNAPADQGPSVGAMPEAIRDNRVDRIAAATVEIKGKRYVHVNGNDREERQRFTACHEAAHIDLGLPSDHGGSPSWSYAKRSPNEILCDVFAAELLLPYKLFKPLVDKSDTSLVAVDGFAKDFVASTMATGSRFATLAGAPCAFVLSERGKVRYASRSKALREANAWVQPRLALPKGSVCERLRAGGSCGGAEEIDADVWLSNWDRGGVLLEDARHLAHWDQTIALIWFEDEEVPEPSRDRRGREEEEFGLAELDGILPWPGRKRRR